MCKRIFAALRPAEGQDEAQLRPAEEPMQKRLAAVAVIAEQILLRDVFHLFAPFILPSSRPIRSVTVRNASGQTIALTMQ